MKTLRTSFSLLLLILTFGYTFAQPYFNPGSTSLVSTEGLNVRQDPEIDAEVIDQLSFGQEVIITAMTDSIFTSKGRSYPFVEVMYQMNGEERNGFIWSGLLASAYSYEGNTLYLLKHLKGGDMEEPNARFAMYKKEEDKVEEIAQIDYEYLELNMLEYISLGVKDIEGFENVENIIRVEISHLACCSSNDELYFLESNSQSLSQLPTISNVFCDGEYPRHQYQFPLDAPGQRSLIIHTETEYDLEGNILSREQVQSIAWNGRQLSPYEK
ncbi:MAG: SH3 domain-containing protein [Bacteroidota bacterium]